MIGDIYLQLQIIECLFCEASCEVLSGHHLNLILPSIPWSKYLHFTGKNTDAQVTQLGNGSKRIQTQVYLSFKSGGLTH